MTLPPVTAIPLGHYAPPAVAAQPAPQLPARFYPGPRPPDSAWGRTHLRVRRAGEAGLPEAQLSDDERSVVARLIAVGFVARAERAGVAVLLAVSPSTVPHV